MVSVFWFWLFICDYLRRISAFSLGGLLVTHTLWYISSDGCDKIVLSTSHRSFFPMPTVFTNKLPFFSILASRLFSNHLVYVFTLATT